MKRILTILALMIGVNTTNAQVETPDLSPRTTVKQKVGLTNFELEYSRPSVRDRKIMGDILPYGQMWRTGANKNTMLTFDAPIIIENQEVAPGTYAIFAKIEEKSWVLYFYTDTRNWGVPREWDASLVAAEVKLPVATTPAMQETFSISFERLGTSNFDLVFFWENAMVSLPIKLMTKDQALASINKVMNGPSDRDYYAAAAFYLDENMELELALTYITKAVEIRGDEAYWYTRKKALIEYALGDKKAAIASAQRSLEAAKKGNNANYVKMNEESIKLWSK